MFVAGGIKADFECGGLCYLKTVGANWDGKIMIKVDWIWQHEGFVRDNWPFSGLPLMHFCVAITDSDNTDKDTSSGAAIKRQAHLLILHAVCKGFTERICICCLYQYVSGNSLQTFSVELPKRSTSFSVVFREGFF